MYYWFCWLCICFICTRILLLVTVYACGVISCVSVHKHTTHFFVSIIMLYKSIIMYVCLRVHPCKRETVLTCECALIRVVLLLVSFPDPTSCEEKGLVMCHNTLHTHIACVGMETSTDSADLQSDWLHVFNNVWVWYCVFGVSRLALKWWKGSLLDNFTLRRVYVVQTWFHTKWSCQEENHYH